MKLSLKLFRCFEKYVRKNPFCHFRRHKHNVSLSETEHKENSTSSISTLFVPTRYASGIYQIVKPFIDVKDITKNLVNIKVSAKLRGIKEQFSCLLNLLNDWESKRNEFDNFALKSNELIGEIKRLKSLNLANEAEILKQEHDNLLVHLKIVKEKLLDAEEVVLPLLQVIPNFLSNLTPIEHNINSEVEGIINQPVIPLSHAEIGKNLGMLKFFNNSTPLYYLTGTFAEIELAAQIHFSDQLKVFNYYPLSGVDFCKSFIVEATGLDPHCPNDTIQLKEKILREKGQKLHLVGGASFQSFSAYLVNMIFNKDTLPSRYFSLGRHYEAKFREQKVFNLFSVTQSSRIHCISVCQHSNESKEFNDLFNLLVSLYKSFKMRFRIVDICARELNVTEICRKQIELWSPCTQTYIPVAYVSQHGDFISKRLNITFGHQHVFEDYCSIVEGVAVNIPVLVGCIVENFQKSCRKFDFPNELNFLQECLN